MIIKMNMTEVRIIWKQNMISQKPRLPKHQTSEPTKKQLPNVSNTANPRRKSNLVDIYDDNIACTHSNYAQA